ncbi:MarR family winged helix-turn-helix transcriptional regulator [Modestobacter muralis]|uniref:MarR family winged helix-turn-helix transcriptional regulator n=1 Tax=Modestobacter muralis TaxID=1608614 RepID=UPI0030B8E750
MTDDRGEQQAGDRAGDRTRAQLDIALLLRRLTVELDAVGARFATAHGLNRTDVRALVAVMDAARSGQPITAGRLGEAVELASASTTALLDRLERVGHLRRVRDPGDGRRVVLEMSESAMTAGAEHFGGLQRALGAAMSGYSEEELALVSRFLTDVTDAAGRYARTTDEPDPRGS